MIEWLSQPWPWYVAGPLIGLVVPFVGLLADRVGIEATLVVMAFTPLAAALALRALDMKKAIEHAGRAIAHTKNDTIRTESLIIRGLAHAALARNVARAAVALLVHQVDLPDGEIIRGAPIGVHTLEQGRAFIRQPEFRRGVQ